MKRKLILLFVSILCLSCSNESIDSISGEKTIKITFDGDFQFEPFTRAYIDETNVDNLWIFDYMYGQLVQTVHQQSDDINFGNPEITLTYGKHDMYFLISDGKSPTHINSVNSIYWETVGDTFWAHATTEINASSASNMMVMLNRVVTMLKLSPSDEVPENLKCVKIIPSQWNYGINYITGEPTGTMFNKSIIYDATSEISLYGISSYDDTYVDFEIYSISDKDEPLKYNNIKNVPFKANRVTTMLGNIFKSEDNYNYKFQLNTTWNPGYMVNLHGKI